MSILHGPAFAHLAPSLEYSRFRLLAISLDLVGQFWTPARLRLRPGGIPRFRFLTRRGLLLTQSRRFLPWREYLVGFAPLGQSAS